MKEYVAIIGGSGFYRMKGVTIDEEREIATPFGAPSDKILLGRFNGLPVAFLSRHGRGHALSPSNINYRANIYALKTLGVEAILAVSAVGSMKEAIHPGDVVVIDQMIDRTRNRANTFFDKGIAVHVGFADPICGCMADILYNSAKGAGADVHRGGTYVCIEGPAFSTRAESNLYRSWGVDVIGMTCYQEAKLAREAEICYAVLAMVTDYDCWHETEEDVNIRAILTVLKKNTEMAERILMKALPEVHSRGGDCPCRQALAHAIITDHSLIGADIREKLKPIIGKYL